MSLDGGSAQEHPEDPKHISETLGELLYDHLEPGRPIDTTLNQFVAKEHLDERREQKLAEENPEIPVRSSSDEEHRREALLAEFEKQRQEQLRRLKKEK